MSRTHLNPHLELPSSVPPSPQHYVSVYPQVPPPQNEHLYPVTMPQPYPQPYTPPQSSPAISAPLAPPPYAAPVRPNGPYYGAIPSPNLTTAPMPSNQSDLIQPVATLTTKSAPVQCPHCNQFVYTVLDYDSGVCTGLSVAGLFMAGLHSGGCLLPFLFPWTKDVTHHCPACKEKIATFARLERDTRVHGNFFQQ